MSGVDYWGWWLTVYALFAFAAVFLVLGLMAADAQIRVMFPRPSARKDDISPAPLSHEHTDG